MLSTQDSTSRNLVQLKSKELKGTNDYGIDLIEDALEERLFIVYIWNQQFLTECSHVMHIVLLTKVFVANLLSLKKNLVKTVHFLEDHEA